MTTVTRTSQFRQRQKKETYLMNPVKFTLWLFLVTVTMFFAAFTSAVVLRQGAANWLYFKIPAAFTISTITIVLSSITMQWAYYAAKKNEIAQNRIALWLTLILGTSFVITQYLGFGQLIGENVFLAGKASNVAGSFFYVIVGLHALHVIGGVIFLIFTLVAAYQYKVHSKNLLRINLCTTYWHFIGGLWVYLFAFLTWIS